MLPWKPLQVRGPRNNKPQTFRVYKKNKIKKKGKEDKECNKYHKPRALQTFLKGVQNSIVTCDLSEENIAGDKGI